MCARKGYRKVLPFHRKRVQPVRSWLIRNGTGREVGKKFRPGPCRKDSVISLKRGGTATRAVTCVYKSKKHLNKSGNQDRGPLKTNAESEGGGRKKKSQEGKPNGFPVSSLKPEPITDIREEAERRAHVIGGGRRCSSGEHESAINGNER